SCRGVSRDAQAKPGGTGVLDAAGLGARRADRYVQAGLREQEPDVSAAAGVCEGRAGGAREAAAGGRVSRLGPRAHERVLGCAGARSRNGRRAAVIRPAHCAGSQDSGEPTEPLPVIGAPDDPYSLYHQMRPFLEWMRMRNYSEGTVEHRETHLRAFIAWC